MRSDSVEYPTSIAKDYNAEEPFIPHAGSKFVQVNAYVTNNGKQPVDMTCGYVIDAVLQ